VEETEYWTQIENFPNYEISSLGRVVNTNTGRIMKLSPTESGDLTVGMMKDEHQYRRSVKLLVARAFVQGEDSVCNTPMLLDCDKRNLRADNITWRPQWISQEYPRQFENPQPWYDSGPIFDLYGQKGYDTIGDAAREEGLLCKEIRRSLVTEARIPPFGHQFVYLR